MKSPEDFVEELYENWRKHPTVFYASPILAYLKAYRQEILEEVLKRK